MGRVAAKGGVIMMPDNERHDMAVIHSSLDPNWRTPPDCVMKLNQEFNFAFDLASDAASCTVFYHGITGTEPRFFGPGSRHAENALIVDWPRDRANFLNPPFSRTLAAAYRTGRIKAGAQWIQHPVDLDLAQTYEIDAWAAKCYRESQLGTTIVAVMPYAPQTDWWRTYVEGHGEPDDAGVPWSGHAAMEVRRLPHRISFLRANGTPAANAGVNSAIVIWRPNPGYVGPWVPFSPYWSYRA